MVQIGICRIYFDACILPPAQFCSSGWCFCWPLQSIISLWGTNSSVRCYLSTTWLSYIWSIWFDFAHYFFSVFTRVWRAPYTFSFFSCLNVLIWLACLCLKAFSVNSIYSRSSSPDITVALEMNVLIWHLLFNGQLSLFLQLHSDPLLFSVCWWVSCLCILLSWAWLKLDIFSMQP